MKMCNPLSMHPFTKAAQEKVFGNERVSILARYRNYFFASFSDRAWGSKRCCTHICLFSSLAHTREWEDEKDGLGMVL